MPVASSNYSVHRSIATASFSPFSLARVSESIMKLKEQTVYRFSFLNSETKICKVGDYFTSNDFVVGGFNWYVSYYPHGSLGEDGSTISLYLHKRNPYRPAVAAFTFHLMDKSRKLTIKRPLMHKFSKPAPMSEGFGWKKFATRDHLEGQCLHPASIVIYCEIATYEIAEPPAKIILSELRTMLKSQDMTDVAFLVDGEVIHAHRLLLVARSPVFKALLCGPLSETNPEVIPVNNMKACVFKAMLNYIYYEFSSENELMEIHEQYDNCSEQFCISMQHLLEAADKYGLDELKFICENCLCKALDVDTVATTLALAQQHGCDELISACLEFMTNPKNYVRVTLTSGFSHLVQSCPEMMPKIQDIVSKICKGSFTQ